MYPAVAELRREGFRITSIDVNDYPSKANKYRIRYLPTLVYVVDDKEVRRKTGSTSKDNLRKVWRRPLFGF